MSQTCFEKGGGTLQMDTLCHTLMEYVTYKYRNIQINVRKIVICTYFREKYEPQKTPNHFADEEVSTINQCS